MAILNKEKLQGLNENFRKRVEELAQELEKRYKLDITITSGLRTPEQQKKVGKVLDSAHLKGLAVDILVTSGDMRYKIVKTALDLGFKRIGVGKRHIHIDEDYTRPNPTIFPDVEKT